MNTARTVAPKRPSGFLSLPSTRLGKWSAWILAITIALILVNNIALMPVAERTQGLQLFQSVVKLAVLLGVVTCSITGLLAIAVKHERSWTAFLAIALLLFVVAMNVIERLPG